jgi:hypothetical protein
VEYLGFYAHALAHFIFPQSLVGGVNGRFGSLPGTLKF